MEFLSDPDGTEYSIKPSYPPGKWYFYEHILKVPNYALFNLKTSELEVYRLNNSGTYEPQKKDENGRFWLPEINLFLGVWWGKRDNYTRNWLRWWDSQGELLLWGAERLAQEKLRSEKLATKLRELGVEID